MLSVLRWTLQRDLLLAWRRRSDALGILFFFLIAVSLFPLGTGAEPALLRSIAPGVLWVAALLAAMLSLGRLFAQDQADGTLEQLLLAPQPLVLVVLAKVAAHWLVAGLPLVLLAPLLALWFGLPGDAVGALVAGLLLGTPVLSLLGAVGAALTLGLRGADDTEMAPGLYSASFAPHTPKKHKLAITISAFLVKPRPQRIGCRPAGPTNWDEDCERIAARLVRGHRRQRINRHLVPQ